MKQRRLLLAILSICLMSFMAIWAGCGRQSPVDPDRQELYNKTVDLFTHVKLNDFVPTYYNEFPYFRDDLSLDEYLNNGFVKAYRSDTLNAIQVDSIKIWKYDSTMTLPDSIDPIDHDTAYVYMQIEYVRADSSLTQNAIRLRWYKVDGSWIKPSLSDISRQLDYEEEIRVYLEAVKRLKEEQQKAGQADSTGK